MAAIFTRVKSEPKFDNTYLAAKKQIYKFKLEQLLRTLRSACCIEHLTSCLTLCFLCSMLVVLTGVVTSWGWSSHLASPHSGSD